MRALVGYFGSASRWAARDKLVRVTQMATLLALEKVGIGGMRAENRGGDGGGG